MWRTLMLVGGLGSVAAVFANDFPGQSVILVICLVLFATAVMFYFFSGLDRSESPSHQVAPQVLFRHVADLQAGSPFDCYLDAINKYAVFRGRTSRRSFWWFWLINASIFSLLVLFDIMSGNKISVVVQLYGLAVLVPHLGAMVRRLHDTGHAGWWIFVPVANLVLLFMNGQQGTNGFGPPTGAAYGVA